MYHIPKLLKIYFPNYYRAENFSTLRMIIILIIQYKRNWNLIRFIGNTLKRLFQRKTSNNTKNNN